MKFEIGIKMFDNDKADYFEGVLRRKNIKDYAKIMEFIKDIPDVRYDVIRDVKKKYTDSYAVEGRHIVEKLWGTL